MSLNNYKTSYDERQKRYINVTGNLLSLLRLKESTRLTDGEMAKTLPGVRVQTKAADLDGTTLMVRIVRWDCYTRGSCGTLQRFWTYVQWWDEGSLHVQVLSAKGESTPEDFLVLKVGDKPILILAEFSYVYRPRPWLLATWQLGGNEWVKAAIFGPNVVADDTWDIRIYGNDAVIESKPQKPLEVAPNARGDGFVFFVTEDKNKAIELRVKDGLVVRVE